MRYGRIVRLYDINLMGRADFSLSSILTFSAHANISTYLESLFAVTLRRAADSSNLLVTIIICILGYSKVCTI